MKRFMTIAVPALALVIAVVFGVFAWNTWLFPQQLDYDHTPVWKPGTVQSESPSSPIPVPSAQLPDNCSRTQEPIVPTRFIISRMGVDTHVLALGKDPTTGAAEAPPDEDAYGVAWFDLGPKPGSDKGNVVLSTHTYHRGTALGNDLYDPTKGLQPGDIIKVQDASGKTVCYRYREALKVWVDEYNASPSNVLYDDTGRAQLAIIICWNYDWNANMSKSRIIFYADPLVAATG